MVPSRKRPLCHPCCSCSPAGATCGGAAAASGLGGLDIGDGVTKRALIRSERHAKDGPRANFAVEPESAIRIGVRAILKVAHPKSTFLSVKSGRIIQSPLTSPGVIGNAPGCPKGSWRCLFQMDFRFVASFGRNPGRRAGTWSTRSLVESAAAAFGDSANPTADSRSMRNFVPANHRVGF